MAESGNNLQNREAAGFEKKQKIAHCVIEDGIRKELHNSERKARENWELKWSYLKNWRKFLMEEAEKHGLLKETNCIEEKKTSQLRASNMPIFACEGVPSLTSGLIGWRSSIRENNLERIVGPMFVSRKKTMNPPLSEDEPDLKYQKFIFLG